MRSGSSRAAMPSSIKVLGVHGSSDVARQQPIWLSCLSVLLHPSSLDVFLLLSCTGIEW